MKKEQWLELKDKFVGREKEMEKYFFYIDPDQVVEFDQMRVKGNLTKNINTYETQFLAGNPQYAPISVVPSINGETYKCMDGTTRAKAKQRAKKLDSTQKLWVSTYHHDVENYNDDLWDDFQDQANDHDGAQPATEEDMKSRIVDRIDSGRLERVLKEILGSNYPDTQTPEGLAIFAKEGGKWAKETLFMNSSRTALWFENKIFDVINKKSQGPTRMVTYTTEECLNFYSNNGKTGYSNVGTGNVQVVSANEKASEVVQSGRIPIFNVGALCTFAINHPDGLFTLVLNYSSTELKGLNKEKLDAKRRNDAAIFLRRYGLFKKCDFKVRIVAMPQCSADKGKIEVIYDERVEIAFDLSTAGKKKQQMSMTI